MTNSDKKKIWRCW